MRAWLGFAVAAAWSAQAFGGVGKVTQLEGNASRTPRGQAKPIALLEGAEVEVGDTLKVEAGANLGITLTDESVIALSEGSALQLDEARFGEQGSKIFSAKLLAGTIWAKVTKLVSGSESKFEVTTERGVAGVRGTIFSLQLAPGPDGDLDVGVEEGEVEVAHDVVEGAQVAAKAALVGLARFNRLERIRGGDAITFGRAKLARHKYEIRQARMAAFVLRNRERWLRRQMHDLRQDLRSLKRDPRRR